MRLPQFRYVRPHTPEEASSFLHEHQLETAVLAGGTALMINLGQRLIEPSYILGLKGITGLDYIHRDKERNLAIGALTTVYDLARSPLITEQYPALAQAAEAMAMPAIQQMATVGGNLCQDTRCIYYNQSQFWRQARPPCFKRGGDMCHAVKGGKHCLAVYQGDLAPVLIALEARIKLLKKGRERVIPLGELFTGKGDIPITLAPDEIVSEIQLPPPSENSAGSYQKLRVREAIDFPLASVAAVLVIDDDKVCHKARLVLGAVAPAPFAVNEAESILEGNRITEGLIEATAEAAFNKAHPVANLSIDPDYRRKMIRVLLKQAVKQSMGRNGQR